NGDLTSTTDFSMQLAMPNGTLSAPLKLSAYLDLRGPVGGAFGGNLHSILQTVRIPIGDFKDVDLSLITGLRFTFDRTPSGTIFLGNIRTMTVDDGVPLSLAGGPNLLPQAKQADNHSEGFHAVEGSTDQLATRTGSIKGVRRLSLNAALRSRSATGATDFVETEITSPNGFPVMNSLPSLRVGNKEFLLSRYPDNGAIDTLIFTLTEAEFAQLPPGEEMSLQYGEGNEPNRVWNLGSLSKNLQKR